MSGSGRVFAINGVLEHIGADVYVIPTDLGFRVEPTWHALTGADYRRHEPADWRTNRFGRSSSDASLWFLDVARPTSDMVAGLLSLLGALVDEPGGAAEGRAVVRVLVPIIGTDRGGQGGHRGHVIQELLRVSGEVTARLDIDIVLVARDRADYAALQQLRRNAADVEPHPDAKRLAELARCGDLALFLGAGVSIPAGLPAWETLLDRVAEDEKLEISGLSDLLDRAELLRKHLRHRLGPAVSRQVGHVGRHSLAHAQLAALGCREVVTTNFDVLYELAAANSGQSVSVLPWKRPRGGQRWLLKLHGDVDHPDEIVLARRDFARFGADRGPAGALLQSLMMTRHLLVVGASMTDANVLRLAHDVMHFREQHGLDEPIGTVLTLRPEPGQAQLWAGELEWISAGAPGITLEQAGRELEAFLDEVAMHAVSDGPYLLDERYAALLDDADQQLAAKVRALLGPARDVAGPHRETWDLVVRLLKDLGAGDRW